MSTTNYDTRLKGRLNEALPGMLSSQLKSIAFGNVLRAMNVPLWRKVPAASPYNLATVQAVALPDDAKASAVIRAYARAGGVTGELVVDPYLAGAAPATGHVAVSPSGDVVVLAADAITDLDVSYEPMKVDVVEMTLPVVPGTGVCALPAALTAAPLGVYVLMEAEALTGVLVQKMRVLTPAAGAPATTNARLDVAKANVTFAIADAVTSARVTVGVVPGVDMDALLEATTNLL